MTETYYEIVLDGNPFWMVYLDKQEAETLAAKILRDRVITSAVVRPIEVELRSPSMRTHPSKPMDSTNAEKFLD